MVINIEENLEGLRIKLRKSDPEMLHILFKVWAVDPISTISLCLLSQQ